MPQQRTTPCTCLYCGTKFLAAPTDIKRGRGSFCSRTCSLAAQKAGMAAPGRPIESLADRFAKYVGERVPPPTGNDRYIGLCPCLRWTGALDVDDHGRILVDPKTKKMRPASAVALMLIGIEVPDGATVNHRCDRGWCIEPTHLYVGDKWMNAQDRDEAGHTARGESSGVAVLNDQDVHLILSMHADGHSTAEITRLLGKASEDTVGNVVNGKTWKHIPRPENFPEHRNRGSGEAHPGAKYTDDAVRQSHSLRAQGYSYGAIAKQLACSKSYVSKVLKGQSRKGTLLP